MKPSISCLPACLLALLAASCARAPAAEPGSLAPLFDGLELRSGDLVFRRGRTMTSRSVLAVDPSPRYSHVGLIRVGDGAVRVVHALPPEGDGADAGGIVVEPLDAFLSLPAASAAAIYRLRAGSAAAGEAAAEAAWGYALAAVPFDQGFDLRSDRALYCTELVWAAYRRAGVDLVGGDLVRVRTAAGRGRYILPSTLTGSPLLAELRRVPS